MWLNAILFLTFVLGTQSAGNATDCLVKEKSKGVLEFAKESINKAKDLLPNCSDATTNSSGCGTKEKAIAFLEIATDLITEAENNFPKCPEPEPKPDIVIPTVKTLDCTQLLQHGTTTSGVYKIWPKNGTSIQVYCDMDTDGGGWTVIQRRGGFAKLEDFYQDWENYKKGFGNLREEFWLGNDNIHHISNQGKYEIRIDLEDFEGERRYAVYKTFWIDDESAEYKLHVDDYSGTAGDSMELSNTAVFSTKDRTHGYTTLGKLCTTSRGTGWWFYSCTRANLNGIPSKDTLPSEPSNLYWRDWKEMASLAKADMKLRRI